MSRLSDNDEDYCAWMSDSICCHGDSDYVGDYPLEEECMHCPYFEAVVDWAFVSLTAYIAGRCFGFNLELSIVTGIWLVTCLIRFVAIGCRKESGK